MDKIEIINELNMTYYEMVDYLIQKYGGARYDYFSTPECKSKNPKVTRTDEGLFCHHIDEDKGGNLSQKGHAMRQPYEWQKKERLVYCNVLEHLILHIKIAVLRQRHPFSEPNDIPLFFTTGGIFMVCQTINDMFGNKGIKVQWRKKCFEEIRDNYQEYILLLATLVEYIKKDYIGSKQPGKWAVPGRKIKQNDGIYEILKISDDGMTVVMKSPLGKKFEIPYYKLNSKMRYADRIDESIRQMSFGFDKFYNEIYQDVVKYNNKSVVSEWRRILKVDYSGYGHKQFDKISLYCRDYGRYNADEYISKALPMYSDTEVDLEGKTCVFWDGGNFPKETETSFYIVRLRAAFDIKQGYEPFVKCYNDYRYIDDKKFKNSNFLDMYKQYSILKTSDIWDRENNRWHRQTETELLPTISLGREDFILFKERYDIRYIEILDGCYFE